MNHRRPCTGAMRWLPLLLLPSLLPAQTPTSVEDRLSSLETRWSRMEADIAQLKKLLEQRDSSTAPAEQAAITAVQSNVQELRTDLVTVQEEVSRQSQALAAEGASRQNAISISSYGQINAVKRSGEDSVIDGESFELIFSGQPHEKISFFSELEFERAASVGAQRGGEVLVEQAYVDYAVASNWSVRAGVVLVPIGNNEADHYAPLRDVISRPLSSRLIAPSDWTDNGFGAVGHVDLREDWQMDWEAYVITGLGGDASELGLRGLRQGFGEDNNNDKALAAHLALRHGGTLSLGLGIYNGAYDAAGQQDLRGMGLDFVWYPAPWKLSGEYLRMRADRAAGPTVTLDGGYLRLGYDLETLLPAQWAGAAFADAKLSAVYEYDYVSVADLTEVAQLIDYENERKHVLGLRFQPHNSWILKLNREWNNASGPALVNGSGSAWLIGIGFVF